MTRYEKSEIRKGLYFELDCPIPTLTRRAPQYGDPNPPEPFAEVSQRIANAHLRLEELLEGVRNARKQ